MRAFAVGRGRTLGLALAGAGVLAAAVVLGAPHGATDALGPGEPAPRNVVVVMTDDQRLDDMKALRKTQRKIGDKGATFTESFASYPLCCPSRATYLTGRYAHNHGVRDGRPPEGGFQAFDDSETTAVALDQAGYRTGFIGKYLNGYPRVARAPGGPYVPPGFDRWRAGVNTGRMFDWKQVTGKGIRRWRARKRNYQTDVYARQAERFIERAARRSRPFFLTVATLAPHGEPFRTRTPNPRPAPRHKGRSKNESFPRPPSFNERNVDDKPSFIPSKRLKRSVRRALRRKHRDRLASLLAVDDLVVTVVRALRRGGALGDTLLIFTSDNGHLLGEHRLRVKAEFYDPAARVPLLVRAPGAIAPGSIVDAPTVNVDLAATIHDFAGVEPAQEQDGISLLEIAEDPAEFADREFPLETRLGTAIRTPDWLYAEHETNEGVELELYDLEDDPDQLESLHEDPQHEATLLTLAARLAQLRECEGASCR